MEFAIVNFRESRKVIIDGNEAGSTNETLRVDEGFHTFSLLGPADFTPQEQTIRIADTTQIKPQEVFFV